MGEKQHRNNTKKTFHTNVPIFRPDRYERTFYYLKQDSVVALLSRRILGLGGRGQTKLKGDLWASQDC